MNVRDADIPDVKIVTPKRFEDERGWFMECHQAAAYAAAGIDAVFVQDNMSLSREAGVVRGLHLQIPPAAQAKLVWVVQGAALDVAVDLRRSSPTCGRHVSRTLSAQNGEQLFIPEGFAHGFMTLEPDTLFAYKVSAPYAPECERGVRWDDPALGIDWGVPADRAVLSPKDLKLPAWSELPDFF